MMTWRLGGLYLLLWMSILSAPSDGQKLQCVQCQNWRDGKSYDTCPMDAQVDFNKVYYGDCDDACFTRTDPSNSSVVVRGCTSYLSLPRLPPQDDCYDWEGGTFCICRSMLCNMNPIGSSSGVRLDDHLADEIVDYDGPLQCYQCISHDSEGKYFPQCPKEERVYPMKTYIGNCTGVCFTRSDKENSEKVYRGCTDNQYGLPVPLPPDGCYNWNGEVYCVCSTYGCNAAAIGPSNGKELNYHLDDLEENVVEPDGQKRCYSCLNYFDGTYYPQCAKDKRVQNAYLAPCNGTCFTRSYDHDDTLVARGCTDTQYGLPDPLPPDGCYSWYSEVWCVCSKSRCNGKALGVSKGIEFDAHIPKPSRNGASVWQPRLVQLAISFLLFVMILK